MNEVVEEYGGAKPTMSRCYVILFSYAMGADYLCVVFWQVCIVFIDLFVNFELRTCWSKHLK